MQNAGAKVINASTGMITAFAVGENAKSVTNATDIQGGATMFEKSKGRYLTRGVDETIPAVLQMFMWIAIDRMPEPKDYLQVFRLSVVDGLQVIHHSAEQPEYNMRYILAAYDEHVTAKVYVIDDGEHCTMLLAEEY